MNKYKKRTTGKKSVIKTTFCLDEDLKSIMDIQPNKSRFINDLIRQYIFEKGK